MAPDQEATNFLYYSWNEGLTWEEVKFSETPIEVTNIVADEDKKGQVFLLYGEKPNTEESVIVTFDFSSLHKEKCRGIDDPDSPNSDYENWGPGGNLASKCLLGHEISFIRRKRESKCYNGEDFERPRFV